VPAPTSPFWARRRSEQPLVTDRCAWSDCGHLTPEPFEVYCRGSKCGRLLAVSSFTPAQRQITLAAVRVLPCALVIPAVNTSSPVPLYVALAFVLTLVTAAFLRHFPETLRVAGGSWLVAFVIACLARSHDTIAHTNRILLVAIVVLTGVAAAGAAAADLRHPGGADPAGESVAPVVSLSLTVGVGLLGATMAQLELLQDNIWSVSHGAHVLAFAVTATVLVGALATAAGAGLARGARDMDHGPTWALDADRSFMPPQLSVRGAVSRAEADRRGFMPGLAFAVRSMSVALVKASQALAQRVLDLLWKTAEILVSAAIRLVNAVVRAVALFGRLIAAAVTAWAHLVAAAVMESAATIARAARSTTLTLIAAAASAALGALAADQFLIYLIDGGPLKAAVALLALAGAVASLTVATWAAVKQDWRKVSAAAFAMANAGGGNVFLSAVIAGWTVGLLGLFGLASVKPGLLTAIGTLTLAMAWLLYELQKRAQSPDPTAPAGEPAAPQPGLAPQEV
jgi:hypothetical protein